MSSFDPFFTEPKPLSGWESQKAGKNLRDNPHKRGTEEYRDWEDGWVRRRDLLVREAYDE